MSRKNALAKSLTLLEEPKGMLDSQYGRITYEEWCKRETARIRANGGQAVLARRDGKVCVARP
jgi:hypothetical protein